MSGPLRPTQARERRKKSIFTVEISPDLTVSLRRMSMTKMLMEGLLPLHLLKAAERFEEIARGMRQSISDGNPGNSLEMWNSINPEELEQTLSFLRTYAVAVVNEPKLVAEDDGNEDHLPVKDLDPLELMAIFYAAPPEGAENQEVKVTPGLADDFRGDERKGDDAATAQVGEGVRPAPKLVDFPDREALHG